MNSLFLREREDLDRNFVTQIEAAILQAATRGQLTEQHPEDGSAETLIREIADLKNNAVKQGKIKKRKALPQVSPSEVPWELPQSWEWARLGQVTELINGRAYKQVELLSDGKWPVLRVGNLFTNHKWYYSNLDLPADKFCHDGDLLYAWSASFGPHIWRGGKAIFHYHIWNVEYFSLNRDYLYYYLLWDKKKIASSTTGSTMVHVSMDNMRPRLLALPPLNEQARIVETLRPLCWHRVF